MKKPKKIRIYTGDGHIFNTFQELKTYVYFHTQEWEQQKYLNRLRKQKKKQEQEINQLETYWALERAKDYTQLEECPF